MNATPLVCFHMKTDWKVYAFQERDMWAAQCVTYDIAVQSQTFDGLIAAFIRTSQRYAELDIEHGKAPFSDFEALKFAPAEIREQESVCFTFPILNGGTVRVELTPSG